MGLPLGDVTAVADDCSDHSDVGGCAPAADEDGCDMAASFPAPGGKLAFRNWCFGVSHATEGRLGIDEWDFAEWGYVRNFDLAIGRIPPNFAPKAQNILNSTSPLVPADAGYSTGPSVAPSRPLIADEVDMITGSPLLSNVDLELPFGGATFRLLRSYSEAGLLDRVGFWGGSRDQVGDAGAVSETPPQAPIGDQLWNWAAQGWMLGEAPLFLIQANYAHLNPEDDESRTRCIFIPDAHHSIPFFLVNDDAETAEEMIYEAPPRFGASLEHNGDSIGCDPAYGRWQLDTDGALLGPSEWYVWMHNHSVKYTIEPVYDAVPFVSDDGDATVHSLHEVPPDYLVPTTTVEWSKRDAYGIPFYGLVTSIEDRLGNRIEITYCDATRAYDQNGPDGDSDDTYDWLEGNDDCEPCAHNCAERGQIKTVKLRNADGEVDWSLHYIYRTYADLPRKLALGSTSDDKAYNYNNHHTLAMILIYHDDVDGLDLPCYTIDFSDCSNWAPVGTGGPGGDTTGYAAAYACIEAQFPFPAGWVYSLRYLYLDHWADTGADEIFGSQVRTPSLGHRNGRPITEGQQCGDGDPADITHSQTRAPLLLQVTLTDLSEESGEAEERFQHTVYRYTGSRTYEPTANGPVLDSVYLPSDLKRLEIDLIKHSSSVVDDMDLFPENLHAFDDYTYVSGSRWDEKILFGDPTEGTDRHLSDYASLRLERWSTADVGIFWDPLTPTGTTYAVHCDTLPDGSHYGTPWYAGACYAYSGFHNELMTNYLLGSGNHYGQGKNAMAMHDGVCLVSDRKGAGPPTTRRIYRFLLLPHSNLVPNATKDNSHSNFPSDLRESWHYRMHGTWSRFEPDLDTEFTTESWLTSAIWQSAASHPHMTLLDVPLCRSILHEPFVYDRGIYEWSSEVPAPELAPWDDPVWVTVVDEHPSLENAIGLAYHWEAVDDMLLDERPLSRRVVAMNAAGYVLWEKEYDLETGEMTGADGLWEEYHYDWHEYGRFGPGEYTWEDVTGDGGEPDGLDDDTGTPWKPCGRLLEHRTFGWSAAKVAEIGSQGDGGDPGDALEPSDGLVYVYDYHTVDHESPSMQIGAKGVRLGSDGTNDTRWREQFIPDEARPEMLRHEVQWSDPTVTTLLSYSTAFTEAELLNPPAGQAMTTHSYRLGGDPDGRADERPIEAEITVFPPTAERPGAAGASVVFPFRVRETVERGDGGRDIWNAVGLARDLTGLLEGEPLTMPARASLFGGADLAEARLELAQFDKWGRETLTLRDYDDSAWALGEEEYLEGDEPPFPGQAITRLSDHWVRVPAGEGENAWTRRSYDQRGRMRRVETYTGRGVEWMYFERDLDEVTLPGVNFFADLIYETREYNVVYGAWGVITQTLPKGQIKFDERVPFFTTNLAYVGMPGLMIETLIENQEVTWEGSLSGAPDGEETYELDLSLEVDREPGSGSVDSISVRAKNHDSARTTDVNIGRWGTIERTKQPDGTITRIVKDTLGRDHYRYIGTNDTGQFWSGNDLGNEDNMLLTEMFSYGEGIHDARKLTQTAQFQAGDAGQYGSWDEGVPSDPSDDVFTPPAELVEADSVEIYSYDERMRLVTTMLGSDPQTPSLYRCEYKDHLDRTRFVAEFGRSGPGSVDPSESSYDQGLPDVVDDLLDADPLSLVESIYDGLGRVIETRTYDVSDASGKSYLASRWYYDVEGRARFIEDSNGGITQTRYDNLGRVASIASGHDFDTSGVDPVLIEATRTDNIYDASEQLVQVDQWSRVIQLDSTQATLDVTNGVRQTTWYFHDAEGRVTASVDLGVGGSAAADEFVVSSGDTTHVRPVTTDPYEPVYDEVNDQIVLVGLDPFDVMVCLTTAGVNDYARLTITCYDEDGHKILDEAPDGSRTRYWYNGYGEVLAVSRNHQANPVDPESVERIAYRYDAAGRLVAMAAVSPDHDPSVAPETPPQSSTAYNPIVYWGADDGTLQITEIEYGARVVSDVYPDDPDRAWSRNGGFIGKVRYPDPVTGQPLDNDPNDPDSDADLEFTYYADGSLHSRSDGRVNATSGKRLTFQHEYDEQSRLTKTTVLNLPDPPVGSLPADLIERIEYVYHDTGDIWKATAYDDPTAGDIVAANEFLYKKEDRGNLSAELQEYGSATIADETDPDASPRTKYAWAFSSADATASGGSQTHGYNYDRLSVMQYPYARSGEYRTLHFSYGVDSDSFESAFNHLTATESRMDAAVGSDHGLIATYGYLGDGRRIGRTWNNDGPSGSQTAVELVTPTSDTGYTHLDRFGRLKDLHFQRDDGQGGKETVHQYQYLRDDAGDVLACMTTQLDQGGDTRDNVYSYLYQYDGLKRLIRAERGKLATDMQSMEPLLGSRQITWGLDSLGNWSVSTVAGREELEDAAGDGTYDYPAELAFTDIVNQRNEIESRTGQTAYIYDEVGNLIADNDFYYIYDAWNRLIQVSEWDGTTGTTGDWIIHYAYDAFGRLIATQRPWPGSLDEVRTTRHYYDGTRRIQDVHIDPVTGVTPPTQSAIPAEGSGSQANPMVNVYVARDYIHTPGYVDELQCMIDSTGAIEHVLQDANYNVVGILDGEADLLAQYVYDPYGSLVAGDIDVGVESTVGHQGLFFDRLDADLQSQQFTVLPDGQGGFLAPVAGIYHNRNRTYHPELGRFLQRDPNGTGASYNGGLSRAGSPPHVIVGIVDVSAHYIDGQNAFRYVRSSPVNATDATGMFLDLLIGTSTALDMYGNYNGEVVSNGMEVVAFLVSALMESAAMQEADLEWASDWDATDDWMNPDVWGGVESEFGVAFDSDTSAITMAGGWNKWIERGMKMHRLFSDRMKEIGWIANKCIPGTRIRPDAIHLAKKIIVELKPNNPRAIRAGIKQLERYKKAAEKAYGGAFHVMVEVYD
jgi:Restriction endonuclease fold toxin 9